MILLEAGGREKIPISDEEERFVCSQSCKEVALFKDLVSKGDKDVILLAFEQAYTNKEENFRKMI